LIKGDKGKGRDAPNFKGEREVWLSDLRKGEIKTINKKKKRKKKDIFEDIRQQTRKQHGMLKRLRKDIKGDKLKEIAYTPEDV